MDELKQRAGAGAAHLDQVEPKWADRIDLTRLDLYKHRDCVLGQLYGHYDTGCAALGITSARAEDLGFFVYYTGNPQLVIKHYICTDGHFHGTEVDWSAPAEFCALTDAWREEIQQRRCATRGRIVVGVDGTASMEGKAPALV